MEKKTNNIKQKLKELTNRNEEEIAIINEILNNHFIIGKNNKKKIISAFKGNLKITDDEADNLYNQCCELIIKEIFNRK